MLNRTIAFCRATVRAGPCCVRTSRAELSDLFWSVTNLVPRTVRAVEKRTTAALDH